MKTWTGFIIVAACLAGLAGLGTQSKLALFGHEAESTSQQNKKEPQQPKRRPKQRATAAPKEKLPKTQGELPAVLVSAPAPQVDFPAITVTADGAVWVSYLEWNRGDTDRVVVRRRGEDETWGEPIELVDGCFEHYVSALAPRGDGVLVVWSGHNDDGFDLYSAQVTADGSVSEVERLTDSPNSDMNVRCASDADGNVTVVWQSFRDGQSDIYLRRLCGDRWSDEFRVSSSEANDWEPAVAIDSTGKAWIAWDSYANGNYDVFLRSFDGRTLGEPIAITTEPAAQFHSTVAVDAADRVWVAWDDGGINWGKDFSRSSSVEGSRGLHYSRTLGIRVYAAGRLQEPDADLGQILTGPMKRYAELPHLAVDRAGTLWMVFRHWTIKKPHEMFHFYASKLTADGWTMPYLLANSSGRNTQRADAAVAADGSLRVVYSSDGRAPDVQPKDAQRALSYAAYMASLPRGAEATAVRLRKVDLPEPLKAPPRRPRHQHAVGDKTYTLLLGDCHRHTDVRGHSAVDGSALDTYRYALDAAQLDFLGLGDHNQVTGGTWPDGIRDYQWWYQQKFVDLFTHEPHFIGIYSYEHSLGRPAGHRNILHLKRGAPMRVANRGGRTFNPDNQPPNLWKWIEANVLTEPGQKVVIVPHTFASGPLADWNWPNADFDCLLEIYQGCRGSYEAWRLPRDEKRGPTQTDDPGHFARDALEKQNVYGFVSFSDHGSTHNSWAGVWVDEVKREAIFDAMLAKRTFGASDEIVMRISAMDTSVDPPREHTVGSQFTAKTASPVRLKIDVKAPDVIRRVDVVKDGRYIYTAEPNEREFKFTFHDMNVEQGENYYYVRVLQRDPDDPIGDPEIGWASPFFVTYE